MRLYELSAELAAILHGNDDGELDADASDKLSALTLAFEDKAEACLSARQGMIAEADALKAEADRLAARANSLSLRGEWLKAYVMAEMQRCGIGKLTTKLFTVSIAKCPWSVKFAGDPAQLPPECQRTIPAKVEIDKAKIKEMVECGVELPRGVEIVQSTYLRIK